RLSWRSHASRGPPLMPSSSRVLSRQPPVRGRTGGSIDNGGTTGNVVQGNDIGTNVAGTAAVGNGTGVRIGTFTTNTTIGGMTAGSGNLIAFNTGKGVIVSPPVGGPLPEPAATGCAILGNAIFDRGPRRGVRHLPGRAGGPRGGRRHP